MSKIIITIEDKPGGATVQMTLPAELRKPDAQTTPALRLALAALAAACASQEDIEVAIQDVTIDGKITF